MECVGGVLAGLLVVLSVCRAGRVLVYPFGHCLNSHLLNAEKLSRILADGGHDVSMLVSTAYDGYGHRVGAAGDDGRPVGLIRFDSPPDYKPVCEYDTVDFMLYAPLTDRFRSLVETARRHCDALLSDPELLRRLKADGYGVVIVEALDPCSRIVADFLDVPFIVLITAGLGHWDGNPRPPSYLPAPTSPYTSDMTFAERLANLLMKNVFEAIPTVLGIEAEFEALKRKHGLNESLRLADSFDRAALKLVNSDFAIDYPAPIEPDTVLIGGYAVDRPAPPLADQLDQFIDSAGQHGVVVVSLGTLTKRYSADWAAVFVEALARLPQKIVWRFYPTDEQLVPEIFNRTIRDKFMLMRWIPQSSLLAHPSTKLFVSHCGLNAVFEAAHYGVPVVALPLSGDQFQNAARLSRHLAMAVTVDMYTADPDRLYAAFTAVLNDPEYQQNARLVAERLRDQPMDAVSKILFWVDYVIRHRGAPHLKSGAHKLSWIQYYSLDVICCLISVLLAVLAGLIFLGAMLFSKATSWLSALLTAFVNNQPKLKQQ